MRTTRCTLTSGQSRADTVFFRRQCSGWYWPW